MCLGANWNREWMRLVRTWVREFFLDIGIRFAGNCNGFLIAGRLGKLGQSIDRESVRVNRRRAVELRRAILVYDIKPVTLIVATNALYEIENVRCGIEKFLTRGELVIQRRECPNRTQLRPDVLVLAQNLAIV